MPQRLALILLLAASLAHAYAPCATASESAIRNPQSANENSAAVRLAVLDLGKTRTAESAASRLEKLLGGAGGRAKIAVIDRDLSRAAARGAGYAGSLNMTLAEARSLGASVGCDFFLTGDAQTIRRSSSQRPVYFESYASVFVVSARTGRLVLWDRPAAEADAPGRAEDSMLAELGVRAASKYAAAVASAHAREEGERFGTAGAPEPEALIDLSSDEVAAAHADLREPAPFRRLRPEYPETASRAEAEATVDAAVEIDTDGRVGNVEIVRWAGFGLDDAVVSTIRRMSFRPAMRDGEPVAVRVLLRYNFRRPSQAKN